MTTCGTGMVRNGKGNGKENGKDKEKTEEKEIVFIADADDKKEPFWPEVVKALASAETVQQTQKEVRVCGVCAMAVTGGGPERSGVPCCRCVSR